MLKKIYLFTICVFPVAGFAQTVIQGQVMDEAARTSLPDVTIQVKGGASTTKTDQNGRYQIQAAVGDTLVFSFVGYTTYHAHVGNQTVIDVALSYDVLALEELVVVGYGTQQKRDVTGAVSSVRGEAISNLPVSGASAALQGRAAGVNVVRNGGAPGNNGAIRIRGTGTINNADPLIIIDGIPAGSLNDVNPNDIASMEILKDASASAIYGTRAANGVIIITTKRGTFEKAPEFSVNAYTGVSNAIKTIEMLQAPELVALKVERYQNDGIAVNPIWQDPTYQVQRTDWQEELLGQGVTQNIDLSFTGGGTNSSYLISGGYYDEKGMITSSYFRRLSLRINSDHKVGKRLRLGQNLQITQQTGQGVNTSSAQTGILWSAIRFNPAIPVRNEDGSYGSSQTSTEFGDINNPIFTAETNDSRDKRSRLLGSVYGELDIVDGLKLRANFGLDMTIGDDYYFEPIVSDQTRTVSRNRLDRSYNETYSVLGEYFLSYNKEVGNHHHIDAVGGYTFQTFNNEGFSASKFDFTNEDPDMRYLDAGQTLRDIGGSRSYDALASLFGRVNYNYDERYLLTATFRADGSSRFADGNKWGQFPAFSLGWRISREEFFSNVDFIDELKLTGGWGQLGNQNVSSLQYLALIGGDYRYSFGGNQTVGMAQTRIANENISWETAEMTNLGLEAGFFNSKLQTTFNYFIKNTRDMLLAPPSIGSLGTASIPDQNVGVLQNRGLEIELGYRSTVGDFSYGLQGNISFIQNEVKKLYDGNFLSSQRYGRPNEEIARTYEGHPIGIFYGWKTDGLYQNANEVTNDPNVANDPRRLNGQITPGDVRFVDIDENGLIDDRDRVILGSPHPKATYGLNADFTWKNFDLNLFFLGSAGGDIFNADRMQGIDPTYSFNMYAETQNRWRGEGTNNSIPKMTTRRDNRNHRASDMFIEPGDFLRLKNVVLGYTLPQVLSEKTGIKRARLYITGQNVFTLTKYSGMDPELGYTDGNLQMNVDYAQYPQSRTFLVGLDVTF